MCPGVFWVIHVSAFFSQNLSILNLPTGFVFNYGPSFVCLCGPRRIMNPQRMTIYPPSPSPSLSPLPLSVRPPPSLSLPLSLSLSLSLKLCSDEGLTLETSANTLFTAFTYPHQPYVDTLSVLPPRRRRPKLVLFV